IEKAEKESHGTDVILTLKQDTADEDYSRFLQTDEIQRLVKKYSNYVRYPIQMETQLQRAKPKPEDAGDDYKTEYEDYTEVQTLNSMIPIWKRSKDDVTEEEINDFYKLTFHDFEDPARVIKFKAEGTLSYDAMLFIPNRQPFDFYSSDYKKGLALYSSGVMIMEKCEDLLPDCFNFVRGIVDSQDLSLNISRETLQQDRQLRAIERRIEKKIKSELADMRDKEREDYEKFFENFGRTLKYGLYASYGQQSDLLADLLIFYSLKQERMVTLDEYIDGMGDSQTAIYYAAGESIDQLSKMPIVKTVSSKGYDVLLCTEDVDEFCLNMLHEYKEKTFQNVASGDLNLETEEEKNEAKSVSEANSDLLNAMKEALGDKVARVTISTRLTDEPVCLTSDGPVSLEMEKILNNNPGGQKVDSQHVLELNSKHDIFKALQSAQALGDTKKVETYSKILYDQALLIEGLPIDDPVEFSKNISELMK
ncbi:MAG: molecular chaperone HtpG, partial [Coriobacteriales bacterium]